MRIRIRDESPFHVADHSNELRSAVSSVVFGRMVRRGEGLPIYEFRKSWKTACTAAGISGRFHDIRATFATDGRKAGIPESVMMALGNWSTRAVFDRYNKIDSDDLKQARETLDRARASG